jgi:hypothetical protein
MNMTVGATICAALALIAASIATNAPDGFHFLWEAKAAAMSFSGIALLLADPSKALDLLKSRAPLEKIEQAKDGGD